MDSPSEAVLIKRYANRKLYNTRTSRYITLKGIAELIEAGQDVRVIDNESGEDITSVTLSQILVDTERSHRGVPGGVLQDLIQRSGDALYGALKRSVGDASEGIEEFQRNLRKMLGAERLRREGQQADASASSADGADAIGATESTDSTDWIALASRDLDQMVQDAVERVFEALDLPRRSDVEALNKRLEDVTRALESLEQTSQTDD